MDGSIRRNYQCEVDMFWDAQPVKADKNWDHVFRPSNSEN